MNVFCQSKTFSTLAEVDNWVAGMYNHPQVKEVKQLFISQSSLNRSFLVTMIYAKAVEAKQPDKEEIVSYNGSTKAESDKRTIITENSITMQEKETVETVEKTAEKTAEKEIKEQTSKATKTRKNTKKDVK